MQAKMQNLICKIRAILSEISLAVEDADFSAEQDADFVRREDGDFDAHKSPCCDISIVSCKIQLI